MSTSNEIQKQAPVTDTVLATVNSLQETGELTLPKNYNAANALKAAWLVLQDTKDRNNKLALEVCSRTSISKALLSMVTKGLSVAKNQCYFIVYGNELQCPTSYFGNVMLAKRDAGVDKVFGQVVYEADEFKYGIDLDTGRKKIFKHETGLANIDNDKIVGAYAIITYKDGSTSAEIMNMVQIRKSWMQGASRGNSPAHKNFPDQMAVKSVINRALKIENASSDDSHLSSDDDGHIQEAKNVTLDTDHEVIEEVVVEEAKVLETNEESTDKQKQTPAF